MKALTNNQLIVANIIYCEQRQVTQVYHVKCSVIQNKFNPQSSIQLKCLNYTQRVQVLFFKIRLLGYHIQERVQIDQPE